MFLGLLAKVLDIIPVSRYGGDTLRRKKADAKFKGYSRNCFRSYRPCLVTHWNFLILKLLISTGDQGCSTLGPPNGDEWNSD